MTSNFEEALIGKCESYFCLVLILDLTAICLITDFKTNEFVERLEKLLKQWSVLKTGHLWKVH